MVTHRLDVFLGSQRRVFCHWAPEASPATLHLCSLSFVARLCVARSPSISPRARLVSSCLSALRALGANVLCSRPAPRPINSFSGHAWCEQWDPRVVDTWAASCLVQKKSTRATVQCCGCSKVLFSDALLCAAHCATHVALRRMRCVACACACMLRIAHHLQSSVALNMT